MCFNKQDKLVCFQYMNSLDQLIFEYHLALLHNYLVKHSQRLDILYISVLYFAQNTVDLPYKGRVADEPTFTLIQITIKAL